MLPKILVCLGLVALTACRAAPAQPDYEGSGQAEIGGVGEGSSVDVTAGFLDDDRVFPHDFQDTTHPDKVLNPKNVIKWTSAGEGLFRQGAQKARLLSGFAKWKVLDPGSSTGPVPGGLLFAKYEPPCIVIAGECTEVYVGDDDPSNFSRAIHLTFEPPVMAAGVDVFVEEVGAKEECEFEALVGAQWQTGGFSSTARAGKSKVFVGAQGTAGNLVSKLMIGIRPTRPTKPEGFMISGVRFLPASAP